MAQTVALVSAEELLSFPSDRRCELIDGVVIDLSAPGEEHGHVAANIVAVLHRAEAAGLGIVLVESGYVLRRGPDTVRAPDVAFKLKERIGPGGPSRAFAEGSPDIVVEVVSPGDTATEIQTKLREWIEGGAQLVLVVHPSSRTVTRVRSLQYRETLDPEDLLDFSPVLPGVTCRVAEFFS